MPISETAAKPAQTSKRASAVPAVPTRPWKAAAVISAVWLASFPAAELAFRAAGDRVTNDGAGMYAPFGDRSYKLAPNAAADFNLIQGRSTVYTNSMGLRCSAQARSWKPGPVDVLVMGDSQSFGWGLNFESTMIGQLAGMAARDGGSVQNLAIGGQYLQNEFEMLRWVYDQGVRPKHITLILTPYLLTMAGGYNRQAVGADGRLYDSVAQARKIGGLTTWLKMHFVTYPRVRSAALAMIPSSKPKEDPIAVRMFRRDRVGGFMKKAMADIEAIRAWADERGISLSVGYAPLAAEYDFAPIQNAARTLNVVIDRDVPGSIAQRIAAEINAKFIDLRPVLAAESAAGHRLTLLGDPHYSESTSAAAAKVLYSGLFGGRGDSRN